MKKVMLHGKQVIFRTRETISKSKRQLAQLLIEAGVTQFPEGANWAAQGSSDLKASFYGGYKPKRGLAETAFCGDYCGRIHDVQLPTLIPNWHQTVLSCDEFDQIVAETVVQGESVWFGVDMSKDGDDTATMTVEPTASPTLDQLLQDWRNADDYAQRKQTEADEAAAMRDERWQTVQSRAGEMGVTVGEVVPVVSEPDDGWIEWGGGTCPVGDGDRVDLKWSDGFDRERANPKAFRWQHLDSSANIIAYRLARP